MAETQTETVADDKTVHGVVAEFKDVDSLLAACRRVRDAGYTKADAFTPFPVHGIDKALGIKPTVLPWIALAAGATGTTIALLMQIGMNGDWLDGISYPYIISGKPFVSLPAFIPVTFELTILLASFGTFFGMWALNGLPKFSNPMFTSPRFDRATDDTFFLFLDAKDERFDAEGAKTFLADLGGQYIEPVVDDDTSSKIPKVLLLGLAAVIALSMIPALVVARMRVTKSTMPRYHIFPDMDFSPAKDAQQTSTLFADGRAMRPDVPGTVIRGGMDWDVNFRTGIDMEKLAGIDPQRAQRLVAMQSDVPTDGDAVADGEKTAEDKQPGTDEPTKDDKPADNQKTDDKKPEEKPAETNKADEEKPADEPTKDGQPAEDKPAEEKPAGDKPAGEMKPDEAPSAEKQPEPKQPDTSAKEPPAELAPATGAEGDQTPWLQENPMPLTAALLERGQTQFGVYCSVCHGMNGTGRGLVHERAQDILASTWTPPSNLHDPTLYQDAYPDGKLFSTISNGIRKMSGYAAQIKAEDRWAVVAYVRALQASRNATIQDVPESQRDEILQTQKKVQAAIQAAEEEAKAKANAAEST